MFQEILHSPSIEYDEVQSIEVEERGWMEPIWKLFTNGQLPEDPEIAKKLRKQAGVFLLKMVNSTEWAFPPHC